MNIVESIRPYVERGLSQREIAKITGIPKSTIQYHMAKHNVEDQIIRKVLAISDLHVPYHDPRSLDAVLQYADDEAPWNDVIIMGDLMDLDFISSFSQDKLRLLTGKTFKNHYKKGNEVLDDIEVACRADRYHYLQGNHEQRVTRMLNYRPTLEGYVEPEIALDLESRGFQWYPVVDTGHHLTIGEAHFIHGQYTYMHHAKKHVSMYGTNVFYGHTHDVQGYSWERLGDNSTIVAQSLGCLCDYNVVPQSTPGAPKRWQQAFGVFYFQANGYFTYYVPRIFHHKFVGLNGRLYEG